MFEQVAVLDAAVAQKYGDFVVLRLCGQLCAAVCCVCCSLLIEAAKLLAIFVVDLFDEMKCSMLEEGFCCGLRYYVNVVHL